jgi:hypothetical protein
VVAREATVWSAAVIWLAIVTGGFWIWERYDTTPGSTGATTLAAAEPPRDRWRLTVFAHPHCPCTRSALRELNEITRAAPELSVRVLFVRPAGARGDWEQGNSWNTATGITGAEVSGDADGAEAHQFGAETSGFAVLTDPSGQIVFCGGLTPGRGRTGESAGRRAVLAWVGSGSGASTAPVFGCPLFTPDE